ncbi:DUF3821 domain-containing protein [Methanoculleus sp. FWC-SCC3]|uniref:DUF3821 domain-containing protein n=1 Tax=Methanoculleus methanifontis TaxID=2584086 RepID=A0ABT8M365_9EURY|nr:MEMAR_RS02690 family S-layer glycoprotein [Methanoculleus sp. FWC-SCC3]MDN7012395.1 DUF3821 domain-containing protein [Methanoculleus sp. FWC-SCC3]
MKSMTKLMVIAMVLAAALVIAPAAAERDVYDGDVIYVGEDNLNLNEVFDASTGTAGTLVYYSSISDTAGTVGRTIRVTNITDLDLTATAVGSATGTSWYAFNSTITDFRNPGNAAGTVLIEDPSADLRVLLGKSGTTSVDGQDVTRATKIRFRINHNLGDLGNGTADAANYSVMEVRVTTPSGGTVTNLGGQPLRLPLSTNQWKQTNPINLTGLPLGTYTARAVWPSGSADLTDSNAVTFNVVSGAVAITSNKDNVVRNSDFAVTITGESETHYWVNVTTNVDNRPMIAPNQVGVVDLVNNGTAAIVKTTAGGTRTIALNTSATTDARTYTIEVRGPVDKNGTAIPDTTVRTESVRVRVEEGAVTITSSGTGVYYIGEEITFSGTSTDNDTVYLFMTGPNLHGNGVGLETLNPVTSGQEDNFTDVEVEGDDTWSYEWNTAMLNRFPDAGGYTVYAAAAPQGRNDLSGVKYASTSIQLRSGFITATTSGATVARGDDLVITGTAQGNPDDGVKIWVFGRNYYGDFGRLEVINANVETDGTFEDDSLITDNLASGQYFVVVQHPMSGGFGVVARGDSIYRLGADGNPDVFVANLVGLQASEAANALIDALDSPYVDDTYVKLTFVIEEAQIFIDAIGDKAAGSTFTISGTTNLAVGNDLNIEVTSAAFQPTSKTEASGFASVAGTAEVQEGDGVNTWSFEVDGTSFKPDQYIVRVESIDADMTATANFNVVEEVPTTQPTTPVETETPEETPTETETTEATPTTQSPGFGALLALAGLGAVAFLVLRRD